MKKSHIISLLTGIIIIFGVIALQTPGNVAASDAGRQLQAVTLTPSEVPADTNTPQPDPPTSTPEPTSTSVNDPTTTLAPDTPAPTPRPNPGGKGNLGLISFWVFIGGISVILLAILAVPFVRDAVANAGFTSANSASTSAVDSFLPAKFVRRWLVILVILMALGTFLGYVLANFI